MCAITEQWYNDGKAEGRAEGKAEGRAEGKAEGRAEGKAEGRAEGFASVAIGMIKAKEPMKKNSAVYATFLGATAKVV